MSWRRLVCRLVGHRWAWWRYGDGVAVVYGEATCRRCGARR